MAELRRLFAPPSAFREGELALTGERLHRVRSVLRLQPGSELMVTDGEGGEYRVRVTRLGLAAGSATVLERTEPARESPLVTVLAQVVPKADRFSLVLEKAVEIGVSVVIPVSSERSVRDGASGVRSAARWRRVLEAAVAQCGRTRLPALLPPRSFAEIVADAGLPPLRLLLWERAAASLRDVVAGRTAAAGVLLAVGPEGGWSEEEVGLATGAGFLAASLGSRTLRTETAGIVALAVLQHRWGDLG